MSGALLARDDSRMLSGLHQRLDAEVFDIIGKGKAALDWKPSGAPSRPSRACMRRGIVASFVEVETGSAPTAGTGEGVGNGPQGQGYAPDSQT
jgi:hypothetical protein